MKSPLSSPLTNEYLGGAVAVDEHVPDALYPDLAENTSVDCVTLFRVHRAARSNVDLPVSSDNIRPVNVVLRETRQGDLDWIVLRGGGVGRGRDVVSLASSAAQSCAETKIVYDVVR